MAEFKVGDRVNPASNYAVDWKSGCVTKVWDGEHLMGLVDVETADGRARTVGSRWLEPVSPLAEYELLIAHYASLCRLALTMGSIPPACVNYLWSMFQFMGIEEGYVTLTNLIMVRAQQGFTYSEERRDAILAAMRAELEGVK